MKNHFWITLIDGNRGDVYVKQGRPEKAVPVYKKDYEESLGNQDQTYTFAAAVKLAEAYILCGKTDSAQFILQANQKMPPVLRWRKQYWKIRALLFERANNPQAAVNALKTALAVEDSARLNNEALNVSKLKTIYELESKDESIRNLSRGIAESQLQVRQQRWIIAGVSVATVLLIAIIFFFYRFNQKIKYQLEIISRQKEDIEEKKSELEAQSESLRKVNKHVEEMNVSWKDA
jgi:hypothetical protein